MGDTNNLRRLINALAKFFDKRLCVPTSTFVGFVYAESGASYIMTALFEMFGQQPPSAWALAATMKQAKRDHGIFPSKTKLTRPAATTDRQAEGPCRLARINEWLGPMDANRAFASLLCDTRTPGREQQPS